MLQPKPEIWSWTKSLLIYREKRQGERTAPCLPPFVTLKSFDRESFHLILQDCSRYRKISSLKQYYNKNTNSIHKVLRFINCVIFYVHFRHEARWDTLDKFSTSRLGRLRHCVTHKGIYKCHNKCVTLFKYPIFRKEVPGYSGITSLEWVPGATGYS